MALHQEFSNGLLLAWPTPIYSNQIDDPVLLDGLKSIIPSQEAAHSKGIKKALVNGWHSETDLMDWSEEPIKELRKRIGGSLKELLQIFNNNNPVEGKAHITAWANVSRRGGFHRLHTHHSTMISGVLHVSTGIPDAGDTEFNGTITFTDPRVAVEMMPLPGRPFGDKIKVQPKPGMMLMFLSWLPHFVDPFRGEGARISIAFNIELSGYQTEPKPTYP